MEHVLDCLGICGRAEKDEMASPELHPSAKFRKARHSLDEKTSTFTVLVTGQGAFPKNPGHDEDGHYSEDDNTSHLITKLLPSQLSPFSKFNPTALNIQILNPTSGPGSTIKSEYGFARKYCKELWERHGNSVDLIIHLGMADGWEFYSIERSGWKQGTVKSVDTGYGRETEPLEYYLLPDDIDQTIKDIPGPNPWGEDVPGQLWAGPGFDVDQIASDVQKILNTKLGRKGQEEIEVLPHPDAGNYLCGFITYESSAQAFVNRYSAKSVFCHVPGWRDADRLRIGRDFVCCLISQIASQQR